MKTVVYIFACGLFFSHDVEGACMWQSEENMNVLGQRLEEYIGDIQTCIDRCDTIQACRSIDLYIEGGVEKCHLNTVTRDEPDVPYVSSQGVTHYYCVSDGSTQAPAPSTTTDKHSDSAEGFREWLTDEPEYFAMIGLTVAIVLLVLIVVVVLCCYVGNEPKIQTTSDVIGLSPIYEEAEEADDVKPPLTYLMTDNVHYVEHQPEVRHPEVHEDVLQQTDIQENPVFYDITDGTQSLVPPTEPEIVVQSTADVEDNARPDSLAIEPPPSELSHADDNVYEQPIPSPPPLPDNSPPLNPDYPKWF